ncbi:MAG: LAGLIDADG family homing endonuclease [candidate division WOR-3 bacterium]
METSFEAGEIAKLQPWYVTGLVEGEGTFAVSFNKRRKLKVGIETRPSFSVTLHRRDQSLLKALQAFFRCGAIRYSRADRTYKFEVRAVEDLVRKVLPHFDKYPLVGAKRQDLVKFAEIVRLVYAKHHLNRRYLRQIIEIAYSMNPSGNRRYEKDDLLRLLGEMKV